MSARSSAGAAGSRAGRQDGCRYPAGRGAAPRWRRSGGGLPGGGLLFLLRNLLLYLLLANAWLHLREDVRLVSLSAAFLLGLALAAGMERGRLRLVPALLGLAAAPFLLRALAFLLFRLLQWAAPGVETDLLGFTFDREFFPSLLPFFWAGLLNLLSLRFPAFAAGEAALNALALLAVFWSQAGYRLRLYPHPSAFAAFLALFILLQSAVLALAPGGGAARAGGAGLLRPGGRPAARAAAGGLPAERLLGFLSFSRVFLPLLLALLVFLLGRYNEGALQAGGGLMKPTLLRFDFSPFVRLESRIELSDELVLLYRREGEAERSLLRRLTLSRYEPGRGFYPLAGGSGEGAGAAAEPPAVVPDVPQDLPDPGYASRREVEQEYFLVNFDPASLVGLNHPVRVTPLKNWDASSFLRAYRVASRVSGATADELREAGAGGSDPAPEFSMPPDARRLYTDFGGDPRIRELALRIAGDRRSPYEQAAALQEYLQNHYYYSLCPGAAAEGDQLRHFLFESRRGYCSYFAFSMALLCRSLGIPARVAVGFWVDPQARLLNFYEVRADQAHAWTEVYLGRYGWIDFDASSTRLAPGEEAPPQSRFDRGRFARLVEEILDHQAQPVEEGPARGPDLAGRSAGLGRGILRGLRSLARPQVFLLAIPAAFLPAARRLRSRLEAALARDPRRRTRLLFRYSLSLPAGLGLRRRPGESLMEYCRRLEREQGWPLLPWCEVYLKAVFAPRFEPEDDQAGRRACARFLAAFRASRPPVLRLLGFLNPAAAFGGAGGKPAASPPAGGGSAGPGRRGGPGREAP